MLVDQVPRPGPDDGVEVHLDAPHCLGRHVRPPGWFEGAEQMCVVPAPGQVDGPLPGGVAQRAPGAEPDEPLDDLHGCAAVRGLVQRREP